MDSALLSVVSCTNHNLENCFLILKIYFWLNHKRFSINVIDYFDLWCVSIGVASMDSHFCLKQFEDDLSIFLFCSWFWIRLSCSKYCNWYFMLCEIISMTMALDPNNCKHRKHFLWNKNAKNSFDFSIRRMNGDSSEGFDRFKRKRNFNSMVASEI